MGIVSFRYVPDAMAPEAVDAVNRRLARALRDDGFALVSTTELDGRPVLRLCPIHPQTTSDDIVATFDRMEALAPDVQRRVEADSPSAKSE
jgi:glutamate/tyrosine decarboxylase-like PLP-dependent enzyme